jgi:TatD DNase family protein
MTLNHTLPPGDRDNLIWVDSHCHLDMLRHSERKNAPDADFVRKTIDIALDAGIGHFLCVSVDLAKFEQMVRCASVSPRVSCSAGIHPSTTEERPEAVWQDQLVELVAQDQVVAVGETGLDYHYDSIPRAVQQSRYAAHIHLSVESGKPLIIHTREARTDTIALLKSEGAGNATGVMHCFTETWEMAKQALDLGFYISFSGIVTFKNAAALREVATKVPMDRLLVETDSPYLAPVPFRGKQNQPAYVSHVGQQIAELRDIPIEALAQKTTENYFQLFSGAKWQGSSASV